ncbi:hypothetical protein K493DRAFT_52144 [Basidiobolus meristosporus CBS 931.73]|uniref:AD domain-containing protein n=1 Tax=Basidiobolus meristosporus CBS 931.73 TaxID=1314790 RepID=A0A1Y1Z3T1_9FUNG|nr:hypothetical protein K493DRAFT_52144 [Basidiobolus meristosporus CBS 931.73]|eukprot:ORY04627.1 hypothetical protein K493DRAFT_52144 [Basidiobolus meristosporus CBS 931.73]
MSSIKPTWLAYDCSYILANIGSKVRVTLKEGGIVEGGLFNLDPSTYSLFLIQKIPDETAESSKGKVLVILEHAVANLEILEGETLFSSDQLSSLLLEEVAKYDLGSSELERRKAILMEHLKESRVPAITTPEDRTVHIMDSAHVDPPYISTSVRCDNDVVKQRVQKILTFIEY